jgi:hypothetical protein
MRLLFAPLIAFASIAARAEVRLSDKGSAATRALTLMTIGGP